MSTPLETTRVTELPNPRTVDLDLVSTPTMLAQLAAVDSELFDGFGGLEGLLGESFVPLLAPVLESLRKAVRLHLNGAKSQVVLSGAGTSGRLAYLLSRAFNRRLASEHGCTRPLFYYLIAGGDKALFAAQEAFEDRPQIAQQDFTTTVDLAATEHVVYIGITCGLSAPYVAGQIDYILKALGGIDSQYTCTASVVLLGFNPIGAARTDAIKGWTRTFADVCKDLAARVGGTQRGQVQGHILTPCLGPEAVTGSSRLKGGTATKVILEVLFREALMSGDDVQKRDIDIDSDIQQLKRRLGEYKALHGHLYQNADNIAAITPIIDSAGATLNEGGRVLYTGTDVQGILAVIDASEQRPTFGAKFHDVQGFVDVPTPDVNDWECLATRAGIDGRVPSQEDVPEAVSNTFQYFIKYVLATLTSADTLILLDPLHCTPAVLACPCRVFLVTFVPRSDDLDLPSKVTVCHVRLPDHIVTDDHLLETATKWILNAVSTCAHVIKGTVYQNQMINVQVSNQKLFYRAVGIIARIAEVDEGVALEALLRAIYECDAASVASAILDYYNTHVAASKDEYATDVEGVHVTTHVERAGGRGSLVPIGVLLATGKCASPDEARQVLRDEPRVRKVVVSALSQKK